MDFEKEKLFEENFPNLYSLLTAIADGTEERRAEWDILRESITDCEMAQTLIKELETFLNSMPVDFEHVVGDVANYYFDDTNSFLRWMENLKRLIDSIRRSLCGQASS